MSGAYTPGLTVTARTRHQVRRLLPIAGEVLVDVGDQVPAVRKELDQPRDGRLFLAVNSGGGCPNGARDRQWHAAPHGLRPTAAQPVKK